MLFGFTLGLAGALCFAWYLQPVETRDIAPWQLNTADRQRYMAAVALAYAGDGDLDRAVARLLELRLPNDPLQALADAACQLATTGFVNNTTGLQSVRAMIALYQPQGRTGCADSIIPPASNPTVVVVVELPTQTPTIPPPNTKTPTPQSLPLATQTPLNIAVPTPAGVRAFEWLPVTTSCSAAESGVIQVYVYEANGATGVPGQVIRVRWEGGENEFVTGLNPERGLGYADFEMEEGQRYTVDMPGLSDAVQPPLPAVPCTDPTTGERAITTYRVVFRAF
jgi:hypothetical protein